MSKAGWLDYGGMLGRMRDPALARTQKEVVDNADSLADNISYFLKRIKESGIAPVQSYWYTLAQVETLIKEARKELENDLFHLGVMTPELFSWDWMDERAGKKPARSRTPKPKKPRKGKARGSRR